jgi:serine/threonine-protein kinase
MGRHPAIVSAVVGGVVLLAAPEQLKAAEDPVAEAESRLATLTEKLQRLEAAHPRERLEEEVAKLEKEQTTCAEKAETKAAPCRASCTTARAACEKRPSGRETCDERAKSCEDRCEAAKGKACAPIAAKVAKAKEPIQAIDAAKRERDESAAERDRQLAERARRQEEEKRAEAERVAKEAAERERAKQAELLAKQIEAAKKARMVRIPDGVVGIRPERTGPSFGPAPELVRTEVKGFLIDETEVTLDAYSACMRDGACAEPDTSTSSGASIMRDSPACTWGNTGVLGSARKWDHPINCVDFEQAKTYCAWAGKRLPKEAEWQLAAEGAEGREYPWGSEAPIFVGAAYDNTEKAADGRDHFVVSKVLAPQQLCWRRAQTCAVGSFPKGNSVHGVKDLAGNVAEWTDSCSESKGCAKIVTRGGGFSTSGVHAVAAEWRLAISRTSRNGDVGFRCAQDAP